MKPEIEVKFVDIDIEEIRGKLEAVGATCQHPMRLMKRALIEEPHHKADRSFIRVRDEGDKVTLCFKRKTKSDDTTTIDSTYELETTVGDFDIAVAIFAEAGWKYVTLQESKRETWHYKDVEVVIDEWPWINPLVEIEGNTDKDVMDAAMELGFDWKDAVFGSVDVIYNRDFPDMTVRGIIEIKEARFGDPVPTQFRGE